MGVPVNVLLDTHALLWFFAGSGRLSSVARETITDPDVLVQVSVVSLLEISTKYRLGKLFLEAETRPAHFPEMITNEGFVLLPVSAGHALAAGAYAIPHGDPFDRLLAAQAELEKLTLVTLDPVFAAFPIKTLW